MDNKFYIISNEQTFQDYGYPHYDDQFLWDKIEQKWGTSGHHWIVRQLNARETETLIEALSHIKDED